MLIDKQKTLVEAERLLGDLREELTAAINASDDYVGYTGGGPPGHNAGRTVEKLEWGAIRPLRAMIRVLSKCSEIGSHKAWREQLSAQRAKDLTVAQL